MRVSNQVEYDFLRFCRDVLRGSAAPHRRGGRLASLADGLTRDGESIPVRSVLEDAIGKAVYDLLARCGGLSRRTYLVKGRRRAATLFDEAVWNAVQPLTFTMASYQLLEALHDCPVEWLSNNLSSAETLGDHLVFLVAARALPTETRRALIGTSPLPGLFAADLADPASLVPLLEDDAGAAILRSLGGELVARWVRATSTALDTGKPKDKMLWLEAAGATLRGYAHAARTAERFELGVALYEYYRRFVRDIFSPEELLAWAAEGAGQFRKVSDREKWLRTVGGLFRAGHDLSETADRIQGLAFVEREEGEKVLFDAVQSGGRDVLTRVAGLHDALVGTIG